MSASRLNDMKNLMEYKAWANRITFANVEKLPVQKLTEARRTNFGSIARTLNHSLVIEEIFRAHVERRAHGHTARNTSTTPPYDQLKQRVLEMDKWWVDYAGILGEEQLDEVISFEFVDGGEGAMSRREILIHLVVHASYHRGFVGDMLNQEGIVPRASDLSVFVQGRYLGGSGVPA